MKTNSDLLGRCKYFAAAGGGSLVASLVCFWLCSTVRDDVPLAVVPRLLLGTVGVGLLILGIVATVTAAVAASSYFRAGMERGSDSPEAWRELVGAPQLEEKGERGELAEGDGEFIGERVAGEDREQVEARREEAAGVPLQLDVPAAFDERGRTPLQRVFDES